MERFFKIGKSGKLNRWFGSLLSLFLLSSFIFLLLLPSTSSLPDETYEFDIRGKNSVLVSHSIDFETPNSSLIEVSMPEDAKIVNVLLDEGEEQVTGSLINLSNTSSLEVIYRTNTLIDSGLFYKEFFNSVSPSLDVKNFKVSVLLLEGQSLKRPINEDRGEGSVYPKPDLVTSDGKRIKFVWSREDFSKEDYISLLVIYKRTGPSFWLSLLASLLFLGILSYFFFLVYKRRKGKKAEEEDVLEDKKGTDTDTESKKLLKHAKDEEKQVIRILNNKNGSCEQKTIQFLTNYSKAKLSRLLSEMEDRNIIHKEKKGRKNIIHLK